MTKVLIIDDDTDTLALMNVLITRQGYKVETAFSKIDALSKLNSFQPSIILLDVLLSGFDGRQFCRELKQTTKTKSVPVIMISAHPGAAENINSYGADDFISKPINSQVLLEKLEKFVSQ